MIRASPWRLIAYGINLRHIENDDMEVITVARVEICQRGCTDLHDIRVAKTKGIFERGRRSHPDFVSADFDLSYECMPVCGELEEVLVQAILIENEMLGGGWTVFKSYTKETNEGFEPLARKLGIPIVRFVPRFVLQD